MDIPYYQNVDAFLERAQGQLSSGKAREASQTVSLALAIEPTDLELNWLGGIADLMIGLERSAAQRLAIAFLQCSEENIKVALYLAAALFACGNREQALTTEELAIKHGLEPSPLYHEICVFFLAAGNLEAAGHLCQALDSSRLVKDTWWRDASSLFKTGLLQIRVNQSEAAQNICESLRDVGATDFARVLEAAIFFAAGNIEEAEKLLGGDQMPDIDTWSAGEVGKMTMALNIGKLEREAHEREVEERIAELETVPVSEELETIWRTIHPTQSAQKKPIVFHHIIYTGGATVVSTYGPLLAPAKVIADQEELDKFLALRPDERTKTKFLCLHMPRHLGALFSVPSIKFTFVRHPLRQIFGSYFWSRRWKGRGIPWVNKDVEAGCTLREFVELAAMRLEQHGVTQGCNSYWFFSSQNPIVPPRISNPDYEEAFRIADREFDFVGITEKFTPGMAAVSLLSGLSFIPKWERQCTSTPPDYSDLDPKIMCRFETAFEKEIEFYERLKNRFETKYADLIAYTDAHIPSLEIAPKIPEEFLEGLGGRP
ncbi:MAG: hypothetical protein A2516_09870 [Alphaproteobacteria bacterium RIFOXYD12_FULL_60_8]|nr:MAG: hypothetical protein A2516_09870 [Alphaproteobacteria bacterium RIFOXYD12_FULL_60_8]